MLPYWRVCILSCVLIAAAPAVWAAGPVAINLEVAIQPGAPLTAPQEWAQRLGQLGLARLQIHSVRGAQQPQVSFNEQQTRIDVLAVLNDRGQLVLPQRVFQSHDLAALREYFQQLPETLAEEGVDRGLFRLTEQQFSKVLLDLGRPLGISTQGKTAAEVLAHCDRLFRIPIRRDAQTLPLLSAGQLLSVDLTNLSAGTALAIALRRDGLTFVPRPEPDGQVRFELSSSEQGQESWPAGWKPQDSPRLVAPQLYESLSVEIAGFTLASALSALAPRLSLPVVLDDRILQQADIQPDQIKVKLPRKKTTLKSTVDQLCSQARLAVEVRVDERDTPFLWITQFGPDSERSR